MSIGDGEKYSMEIIEFQLFDSHGNDGQVLYILLF